MTPEFMTTEEVAELVRVPVETVRFWRHIGRGPASFKLGRRVLYPTVGVRDWIDREYATQVGGPRGS